MAGYWQGTVVPCSWAFSMGLLGCPQLMAASVLQNEWSKKTWTRWEPRYLPLPNLSSDLLSFPHSTGHADKHWYSVGGDYTRLQTPGEDHLGGWLPHSGPTTFIYYQKQNKTKQNNPYSSNKIRRYVYNNIGITSPLLVGIYGVSTLCHHIWSHTEASLYNEFL